MKKFIILIIFIFLIIKINCQAPIINDPIVTLIVDSNNNNSYTKNGYCGNLTITCNTINDAMNYFNTIKNIQTPPPGNSATMYQQLNLLLKDGKYNFTSFSNFNVYQYNLTISPFTPSSENVIIDGSDFDTPLFSISSGTNDNYLANSYFIFTNIQFSNFQQPIIKTITESSFTDIRFESCTFYQFNTPNIPMIDINSGFTRNLTFPNSHLKFNFSNFESVYSNAESLIVTVNTIVDIVSINVNNGNFKSFLNSTFGDNVNIRYCTFSKTMSSNGIFSAFNNHISIGDSIFTGNIGSGPSVLSFTSNTTGKYEFAIGDCQFIQNSGQGNGGVVNVQNTNSYLNESPYGSNIQDSIFSGNTANQGGVLYGINMPLTIQNCSFDGNTAKLAGGNLYFEKSLVNILNSTFTKSSTDHLVDLLSSGSNQVQGQVIYSDIGGVTINGTTFDDDFSETIYCIYSLIVMDQQTIFDTNSMSCQSYCTFNVGSSNENICKPQSSTSGTGTGGTSTGGNSFSITTSSTHTTTTGSTSNSNNNIFSFSLNLLIFNICFYLIL